MEIVEVKIADLKPAEYNPRAMTRKEAQDLEASLDEFGMVEPIVVNSAPERKNVIIGGHQRYNILKKKGMETAPVYYINLPDIQKERELNLRLNKNVGHFDSDLLANFEEEMLKKVGFTETDLSGIFKGAPVKGEIEFSTELLEEHNYVVLVFDNTLDWNVIQEKLGLKAVKSNYRESTGLGRVIDGKKVLELIEAKPEKPQE